jgi:serine protease Do
MSRLSIDKKSLAIVIFARKVAKNEPHYVGGDIMTGTKKFWVILPLVLILGLAAGRLIAPSRGVASEQAAQEKAKAPAKPAVGSPARELAASLSQAFEEASAKVSPAVVPIFAEQTVEVSSPFGMPDDPFKDFFGEDFFKRFFGAPPQQEQKRTQRSLGSGVIVSADGLILTNNHVVEKADKLSVVIGDNKKIYSAKVVGTDPMTDVAVIRIDAKNLPVAALGNSDEVKVGEWVIAIGNPFQLMHTVTAGIISAKGRSSVGLATYEDFIQTDASINPGNSGGALADLDGNVIGINTAIASPSGGSIGIGFAIPINMAKQVMEQLIAKGKVVRGYLGVTTQDIDEDLAKALKLKQMEGSLIGGVDPKGPADRAGIKPGDVILEFNGEKVTNSTQLRNLAAQTAPGTTVKITLLRDGQKMDVTATLAERPREKQEKTPQPQEPQQNTNEQLGLRIQNLTPDIAGQLGYKNEKGVIVADVASGSPAEDAGLQRGDLIKEVNKAPVLTTGDFVRAIRGLKSGDAAAMLVRRGPSTFYAALRIP